jgi:hypothetical protein
VTGAQVSGRYLNVPFGKLQTLPDSCDFRLRDFAKFKKQNIMFLHKPAKFVHEGMKVQ